MEKSKKIHTPKHIKKKTTSVAKSTLSMAFATFVSRVTGLLRTWIMAFALGNTVMSSAYQVANNMPNVIFDLVAGGLLGAAFIPIFILEKQNNGEYGANRFSSNMLNLTVVVLGLLSILSTIFAPFVISTQTFTVDNSAQVSILAVLFFRIFAFQILFYGISGIINGILNSKRIYFLPALAPAINNIFVILSFIAYYFVSFQNLDVAIYILGIGTTLGVLIQCLVQIPSLIKSGFKWYPVLTLKDKALKEAIKIAIPTFIYIVGNLIAFTFRNAFSLVSAENGPSTILYAWTWFQLPYGIVAVSLSRTMFTELSESSAKNDKAKLKSQINDGIRSTLTLIIPLSVLIFSFSQPILSLFRAGSFNSDDVNNVAIILRAWIIALPFYSVLMYMYNVFAALRKFSRFAIVCCSGVVFQCLMYWIFCQENIFQLLGIPLSDLIYYTGCCIIVILMIKTEVGYIGVSKIVISSIKILIASLIAVVPGILLNDLIFKGQISMLYGMLSLILCGGISIILIIVLCWIFKIKEVRFFVSILLNKIKGK